MDLPEDLIRNIIKAIFENSADVREVCKSIRAWCNTHHAACARRSAA